MTTQLRAALAVTLLAAPACTLAAAFGVTPIRVDLDPGTRTAVVNVTNDDVRKLYFQVKLARWTQDPATGEDRHEESQDLVFFPQVLTIEPKERRIVRVGLKGPPPVAERAYRLFIEELPDPQNKGAAGGAQIAVRLRFGVPIFASAGKGEAKPEYAAAEARAGEARVEIRNTGDRSVRFESLELVSGARSLVRVNGWYVFPGTARWFTIPVERAACPLPSSVEISAVAGGKDLRRPLEGASAICGR